VLFTTYACHKLATCIKTKCPDFFIIPAPLLILQIHEAFILSVTMNRVLLLAITRTTPRAMVVYITGVNFYGEIRTVCSGVREYTYASGAFHVSIGVTMTGWLRVFTLVFTRAVTTDLSVRVTTIPFTARFISITTITIIVAAYIITTLLGLRVTTCLITTCLITTTAISIASAGICTTGIR